ncbi:MAG: Eco57I restriction-modification methylase domain-containing protein [Ferrovibrio sp.]|uniref:Eco57I restriction-modification methylase domain-containing protein n=1 Tax=Ferrovibrio sp. TaxID=1917215 RepID=UPI00391BA293
MAINIELPITPASVTSGYDLARRLGWQDDSLSQREISRGETKLKISRATLGGHPTALFAKVVSRNGYDPLESAALYAYHSTVDWGVLADDAGITVFNSHWLLDGDWFKLPRIGWKEISDKSAILDALKPASFLDRNLERFASSQKTPSGFLKPVDDELVERLDSWRDQALRYAKSADKVDEQLQTLYAQFFVLRTVEDRELNPKVPSLKSVIGDSEHVNWAAWEKLLSLARKHVGSDLFDDDVVRNVPEHVTAGVISDLYTPRKLPGSNIRYDFSWIEADVLGLAYEKYLATVLQPAPVAPQMEMFLAPSREVERVSIRKSSGTYYTPKFIRDYLSSRCVDEYFNKTTNPVPPKVIDFSCGSGSFLVGAVDHVLKHLRKIDPNRKWARELIEGGFIVGIDIDPRAVTTARLNLWQRLVEEPDALPLPNLSNVVITGDGLKRETWGDLNKQYDIVLGNPPFLATSLVVHREELEAAFQTAKGRYDFSYLFVEQALNVLNPGGHMGMVVPNRIYRNRNGATIRSLLVEATNLLTLVDFGANRPFDASAYIACILAQLRQADSERPARVRVLEVKSLDSEFLTAMLLDADANGQRKDSAVLRSYFARHPSTGEPWPLLSESEQLARVLIEDISVRLDTLAAIPQGIRTGGNDIFIFNVDTDDSGGLCRVINGLGDSAVIERDLLEDVVFGSEVQRYQAVNPTKRLLYPYRKNIVLPEAELSAAYPKTWAYLMQYRELLSARSSLKNSSRKWYELIRARDENWLRKPKLMIRDLAPGTAFALDANGSTFLVGGTAVVPEQQELILPLLAYLNSSVVDHLVRRSTPQFRGDFQKFEPQHIQGIPILDRVVEDADFAAHLGHLAASAINAYSCDDIGSGRNIEEEINLFIKNSASERGISLDE